MSAAVLDAVVVLALVYGAAALTFLVREVWALRRDMLHAGMDCHQVLVAIAERQAMAMMPRPARPEVADAVTEETPEEWLARQRDQVARRGR